MPWAPPFEQQKAGRDRNTTGPSREESRRIAETILSMERAEVRGEEDWEFLIPHLSNLVRGDVEDRWHALEVIGKIDKEDLEKAPSNFRDALEKMLVNLVEWENYDFASKLEELTEKLPLGERVKDAIAEKRVEDVKKFLRSEGRIERSAVELLVIREDMEKVKEIWKVKDLFPEGWNYALASLIAMRALGGEKAKKLWEELKLEKEEIGEETRKAMKAILKEAIVVAVVERTISWSSLTIDLSAVNKLLQVFSSDYGVNVEYEDVKSFLHGSLDDVIKFSYSFRYSISFLPRVISIYEVLNPHNTKPDLSLLEKVGKLVEMLLKEEIWQSLTYSNVWEEHLNSLADIVSFLPEKWNYIKIFLISLKMIANQVTSTRDKKGAIRYLYDSGLVSSSISESQEVVEFVNMLGFEGSLDKVLQELSLKQKVKLKTLCDEVAARGSLLSLTALFLASTQGWEDVMREATISLVSHPEAAGLTLKLLERYGGSEKSELLRSYVENLVSKTSPKYFGTEEYYLLVNSLFTNNPPKTAKPIAAVLLLFPWVPNSVKEQVVKRALELGWIEDRLSFLKRAFRLYNSYGFSIYSTLDAHGKSLVLAAIDRAKWAIIPSDKERATIPSLEERLKAIDNRRALGYPEMP